MPKAPSTPRQLMALYLSFIAAGALLLALASWGHHLLMVAGGFPGVAYLTLPAVLGGALGAVMAWLVTGRAQADRAAHCDPLTALPNRAGFSREVSQEIARAERYGGAIGMLMFDVDKFKDINDSLGHSVGDQVLVGIAEAVASVTRRTDFFARWAGDEFVVLAPGTGARGCRALAEKIRQAVAAYPMPDGADVTVSLGISHYVAGDDERSLLRRADEALYQAKRSGRNRVTSARFLRSTGTFTNV